MTRGCPLILCPILVKTLWTKIGQDKYVLDFLTYFGSVLYDIHFMSRHSEKRILWTINKLMFWGHPTDVTVRVSLCDVSRNFLRSISKTERTWKLKLYILPSKLILYLCSNLMVFWRPRNVNLQRLLGDVYNMSLEYFSNKPKTIKWLFISVLFFSV